MNVAITSGILTSLPGRYAKALFDLANEADQVAEAKLALNALTKLIQSSNSFKQILANPTIQRADKVTALNNICVRMKAPEIVRSFIGLLVKEHRISYLTKIEEIFQSLVSQAIGEQRIEVITAYPLTPAQSNLLKDKLKKNYPGTLSLIFSKNPNVLGGIMIRVGSRVIDATLATQLNQLATAMKGST